ncbi:HNH endonuclease signature motif containing protein [Streptomyces lunaelactis]|uniref:HNH endonuclease signature motif containing protein n=1 Tax=Streptomyces lunaelactis TaxID=1535768 RepID=UPI001584E8FF|nr:HNH endonuclease signature motif containing protein [Streptomyces lunaelactis]NUL24929.1 HNH endonuclease [Streptomyces lunaelactis]
MARSYSEKTIKLLFGSASRCAYPECPEPLVFKDRGRLTVVAQVAHIRSEMPNGPRHELNYDPALLNSFENLLLLCGKHHPPVDQHESVYAVEELEEWKAAQTAQTGRVLPASELPEIIAGLEKVAHAQERRAALRSTWESFTAAALPFLDHAQGATSRDASHLNEQVVRDRRAFNVAIAAVLREGPPGMVELAVAVRDCCDALIRHANIYGPGWIAWRALDEANPRPSLGKAPAVGLAQYQLGALIQAVSGGGPAPEAVYLEAEAALQEVEGLTAAHVHDLLEDASRPESRRTAVDDLNAARESFYEALEQFEKAALAHLASAP